MTLLFKNKKFNYFLWALSFYINEEKFKSLSFSGIQALIPHILKEEIYEKEYIGILRFMIKNKLESFGDIISFGISSFKLYKKEVFILLFDEFKLHEYAGFCKIEDADEILAYDWTKLLLLVFNMIEELKIAKSKQSNKLNEDHINDFIEYMEGKYYIFKQDPNYDKTLL